MKVGCEIAVAMVLVGMTVPATDAHEFWIDGTVVLEQGETLLDLDLKVGQMLDGISLPYVPDTSEAFEWVQGGSGAIPGVPGNVPAAKVPIDPAQNAIVFHRTAPRQLVHRDWEKFLNYLAMEGLDGIAEAHDRRELPQSGFVETYARHAKFALVAPDGVSSGDEYLGSPLEFVLDKVASVSGDFVISGRVIDNDGPGARHFTVFHMSAHGTETLKMRSREDGAFIVTVPENRPVLLNAVRMSPGPSEDIAWHSDWASIYVKQR